MDDETAKTKYEKLKEMLVEKGKNTTSHGWPRILEAPNLFVRIMWIFFLLSSLALCGYLLGRAIQDYLEFGVVTNAAIIQQAPIEYPSVTICNLNPFVTQNATDYILDHFSLVQNKKFSNLSQILDFYNGSFSQFYYQMLLVRHKAAGENDSVKQSFGYSFKELIIRCQYNNKLCGEADFDWIYNPIYGNCFRFNMGFMMNQTEYTLKKAFYAGETYGLKLELYVGLQLNNTFSYQTSTGVRLFIQNQTIVPLANEGLTIQAGKTSIIKLNKVITENVPDPYSNCKDIDLYGSKLTKYILNSELTYRYKYCMSLCLQMLIIEKCGCFSLEEPFYETQTSPCYLQKEKYDCYLGMYNDFSNEDNYDRCRQECPIECEMESFNLEQSISDYPSRAFSQELFKAPNVRYVFEKFDGIMPDKLTFENLQLGTVSANIYYEELKYTTIEQSIKTTIVDLVANLGGTLGLFIGASILSFGEIFEILVEAYYIMTDND